MSDTTLEATDLEVPDGFPAPDDPTGNRALLDTIVAGTAIDPPYMDRLALPKPTAWTPGRIESATTIGADVSWAPGVVFGGYLLGVADLFAGLAMLTVVPDDAKFLTVAIESSFHTPVAPGAVHVEAVVREITGRKALVDVAISQNGQVTTTVRAIQKILRRPR
jgi:acyl-coenzyme A thioesterase PaaI-like protein